MKKTLDAISQVQKDRKAARVASKPKPKKAQASKPKRLRKPRVAQVWPPRMPHDELVKFTQDLCDGRIFTSADVPQKQIDSLLLIFLPLAFRAYRRQTKREQNNIGVFWEYMTAALPRGVNGYPMFTSVRALHKDDWQIALEAARAEMARRAEGIKIPENAPKSEVPGPER